MTPGDPLDLAIQHHLAGRRAEAEALYRQILAQQPRHADALHLLGVVMLQAGQPQKAFELVSRAIATAPHAQYHNTLGNILDQQGKVERAIAAYRAALAKQPDYFEALNNLGNAHKQAKQLDEAIACYERAIALNSGSADLYNNLGNAYKDQARLDEALACYRRALALQPDYQVVQNNLLYTLWFHPDYDARGIFAEHRRWNQLFAPPPGEVSAAHPNDRQPGRRLRIGYVSPDFREHCQAFFTVPLLAHHDHTQFEVFCYSDVTNPDAITARLRGCADSWHAIAGLSDPQLGDLIRRDQIDVLVDLTMHMAGRRLPVFARKPAPVQVCWLAYPGTTGLETIDYRLTDPQLDPPGLFDAFYSETSVRLPETFWCYDPLTAKPAVNPLPALGRGHITFGCLNNFCKVNDPVLQLWARVLLAVEGSRLLLLAPAGRHRQHVLDVFARAGVGPDRIEFVLPRPRPDYLCLYHQIDLGLDTFPYNGHTTSLDSYWMGVPVVTLVGETVVGRAGWSQLYNLQLTELAAHSPDEFVQIATALARDPSRLAALRADLRPRISRSPLMDAPRFARRIEAAYRDLWQRWCLPSSSPP